MIIEDHALAAHRAAASTKIIENVTVIPAVPRWAYTHARRTVKANQKYAARALAGAAETPAVGQTRASCSSRSSSTLTSSSKRAFFVQEVADASSALLGLGGRRRRVGCAAPVWIVNGHSLNSTRRCFKSCEQQPQPIPCHKTYRSRKQSKTKENRGRDGGDGFPLPSSLSF